MPPKNSQTSSSNGHKPANAKQTPPKEASDSKDGQESTSTIVKSKPNGKKRKAETSSTPNKAPRRSARRSDHPPSNPVKTLNYLLSPSSLNLTRPKDEISALETSPQTTRTYSTSTFTPFEELVCATILSRPIGHMLGLRSIRTIFNAPYDFTTPKKIRAAGQEGCRKALDAARTQHRQKTAEELVLLADAVVACLGDGDEDVGLDRVRREAGYDVDKEREMLKKNVKGFGKTGLEIFGRRIQGVWPEFYPFIDDKTLAAVDKLGLPKSATGLKELIEEHWDDLELKDVEAKDTEERKRRAFVRILERAVGADLEGNVESMKTEVV